MRLIDADKLKEELRVNGLDYQYYMLDNAPTVEAIPIEWTEEYIENYDGFYVEETKAKIQDMLEDWEKENEC